MRSLILAVAALLVVIAPARAEPPTLTEAQIWSAICAGSQFWPCGSVVEYIDANGRWWIASPYGWNAITPHGLLAAPTEVDWAPARSWIKGSRGWIGIADDHRSLLPDAKLTPGVIRSGVTKADLCPVAHTPELRHVTESTKRKVFAEYGINPRVGAPYEVDHLISLELGGSNDIQNLWPESYASRPFNAHMKDALENRLHALVCAGGLTLQDAQRAIATDWIQAYRTYVSKGP